MIAERHYISVPEPESEGHFHRAPKSPYNPPEKFFSVCAEGFFQNPDKIRDFGLSLPSRADSIGRWPGTRTPRLDALDQSLANLIVIKILGCYFDLVYESIGWDSCLMSFQKVSKLDEDKNSIKNKGWVHQDSSCDIAAIVYLTPNIDPDTGTSLFNVRKGKEENVFLSNDVPDKRLLYTNEKIDTATYENNYRKHEENYIETARFQNIYNRLVVYDAQSYHRANSFYSDGEDRLTLVTFVNGIKSTQMPLQRVRGGQSSNIDQVIEKNMENMEIPPEESLQYAPKPSI